MDITSANATLTLSIPGLFPVVQIQGFSTDDAFDTDTVEIAQVVMGVDGNMSAGIVPVIKPQTITLQADSPSAVVFDSWVQAQDPTFGGVLLPANETLSIPSIGLKVALINGVLRNYTPISGAKKVLQPRRFTIVWQTIQPAPF
jgi:hypothetical protein